MLCDSGLFLSQNILLYCMHSLDTGQGMIHIPGRMARDFIRLLRMMYNVKLLNCLFLEFLF